MTKASPVRRQKKADRLAKWITFKFLPVALIPAALLGILVYWYWQTWYYQPYPAFLQFAALLLGAALIMTILGVSWAARRLANPLEKLSDSMKDFSEGNWDARAHVLRKDALGNLAEQFNLLADEFCATQEALTLRDQGNRDGHNQTLQWIAGLAARSTGHSDVLAEALKQITRSFSCAYSVLYLLDYNTTLEKRFVVLKQDYAMPGFDPSILISVPQASRINLDAIATLDWLVSRVIASGEPGLENSPLNPGLAEAAVPLVYRGRVIGVIDLFAHSRSSDPRLGPFGPRVLAELQHIAGLLTLAALNLEGLSDLPGLGSAHRPGESPGSSEAAFEREQAIQLYEAGNWITQSASEEETIAAARRALAQISLPTAVLLADADDPSAAMHFIFRSDLPDTSPLNKLTLSLSALEVTPYFNRYTPILAADLDTAELPQPLLGLARQMDCDAAAYLPVLRGGLVNALLVLGRPAPTEADKPASLLPVSLLGPYHNLIELLVSSLEKIRTQTHTRRQLSELRVFSNISQAISLESDLTPLFETIHHQLETVMGEMGPFAIALYEPETSAGQPAMIDIPYMYEEGHQLEIAPFPLGEGLTSILINTRKSLLLSENVGERLQELGAKIQGDPAKSWLGVPMIYSGEVIGAIIVQDTQREQRFDVEDEHLLNTLAPQVAVVVRNARLLETTSRQAQQEHILNEITDKIRRAPDIDSILKTTATELGAALGVERASIRLSVEPEARQMEAER
ncbi:MAG: GAF domain-containing protein [Anaerolineales bacterium]|nr:GAF domain-containing protein [Anaerolineales bacterium]